MEATKNTAASATCSTGWHPVHPRGYACAGEGIRVLEQAPAADSEDRGEARRDRPLPYQYYMVKEAKAAEYHQLPSRDQQRATRDYVTALLEVERGSDARKLKAFLEGQVKGQPVKHPVVRALAPTREDGPIAITPEQFERVFEILRGRTGVDFRHYKAPTLRRHFVSGVVVARLCAGIAMTSTFTWLGTAVGPMAMFG